MRHHPRIVAITFAVFVTAALRADIVINESSPSSGVPLGSDLAAADQPVSGYLILCEGKLAADGSVCFAGDSTHPNVGISDIVQWGSVTQGLHTDWFVKLYSDIKGADETAPEPNTIDSLPTFHEPLFACPIGSVCLYRREPGVGDFGGFDPTTAETLSYTPADGQPGFVKNDSGRIYNITSDPAVAAVPEPSSLLLLGLGLFGVAGVHRRRLRVHEQPSPGVESLS
jgi:hypothetical protein